MYLTLIILPFVGAAVSGFLGRSLGTTGAVIVSTTCIAISAVLSLVIFYEVGLARSSVSLDVFTWADSGSLTVS